MELDRSERRCPRLGSVVTFGYCRKSGKDGGPCWKVFDCWWETFDVVGYFRQTLSPEAFSQLAGTRPRQKVSSLLEIIEQARKNIAPEADRSKAPEK